MYVYSRFFNFHGMRMGPCFLSVRVGVSCAEVSCKRSQDDMDVQWPLLCAESDFRSPVWFHDDCNPGNYLTFYY
jgi:hypothetical protein